MADTVYFDDVDEGLRVTSARRTITDADIMNFAGVSGDFNPLHTDDIFIREETPFRGRIAHGLLGLAIGSGLKSELDSWLVLAYLTASRDFVGPIYPGDTIWVEYEVTEKRASRSKPDRGIVTLSVELKNHDGEVAQRGTDVLLLGRREDAA
jgi:3-hydroxybutyryl-CoA dehydratase